MYLEVRQHALDSNLYLHFDGADLTRYQFSIVLQRALSFCEVKGHFRPHSFRIGAATEAKRVGIHDDVKKNGGVGRPMLIRNTYDWISELFIKYLARFHLYYRFPLYLDIGIEYSILGW